MLTQVAIIGRRGVEVFKEMSENDDIVGAVLFAIEMLMRQVEWNIKEAGNTEADKRAAEFIYSCMHDMDETWTDFISEVLSFLTFGWSYHEIVYKRRMGATRRPETKSKYDDGLIGWRKLPNNGSIVHYCFLPSTITNNHTIFIKLFVSICSL